MRELILEKGASEERGADESPLAATRELWTCVDLEHDGTAGVRWWCSWRRAECVELCVRVGRGGGEVVEAKRGTRRPVSISCFEGPVDEGIRREGVDAGVSSRRWEAT